MCGIFAIVNKNTSVEENKLYSIKEGKGFGDYEMSFNLLNPETRKKAYFELVMQINGTIVNIEKFELHNIRNYVMDGVDLEKYLVKD